MSIFTHFFYIHKKCSSLSSSKDIIPKEFRKTTDLTNVISNKNLQLSGLNKLNISGSQEFSEYNIPILIKTIGTNLPMTVVDLRQESHGFINGIPVSWTNLRNNANEGLSRDKVLLDERNKLKSVKINETISLYNRPNETIIVKNVKDESELINSKSLSYTRITVKDGGIPLDDMVDYFVDFAKVKPRDSWLHFHCKAGVGRTTTFMIMYDMIKNYKEAIIISKF